jgi:hypothetical protein
LRTTLSANSFATSWIALPSSAALPFGERLHEIMQHAQRLYVEPGCAPNLLFDAEGLGIR